MFPVTLEPDPDPQSAEPILVMITTVVVHLVDTALDVRVPTVTEAPAVLITMMNAVVDTVLPQEPVDLLMNTHPLVVHSRTLIVVTTHLTHMSMVDLLQETILLQEITLQEKLLMIMSDHAHVTNSSFKSGRHEFETRTGGLA